MFLFADRVQRVRVAAAGAAALRRLRHAVREIFLLRVQTVRRRGQAAVPLQGLRHLSGGWLC